MVFYVLYVGAELDGITNLQPRDGCDDPNYAYYFKVKCEYCGETSAKDICICIGETVTYLSGRGTATANVALKCKLCERVGSIKMIPGQGRPLTLEQSQAGKKTRLMSFDSRGYEPIDFTFGDGWKAESVHGTSFDIDLSKGEFTEYDEIGQCPVGLSKLQSTFEVMKNMDSLYRKTSHT